MGMPEKCQNPLGREPLPICGAYAHQYRQCAAGCNKVIAYCEKHGGDQRALDEIVEHHKTHSQPSA